MSIKIKLTIGFGLLITVILAVFWLALKIQLEQTLSQQTRTLGQILAKQTADSVTELVLANDLLGLNVVLGQLAREPGINSVTVTDVDGIVLASTAIAAPTTATTQSYQAPVTLQDAVAGQVTLLLDEALLSNPLARPHTIFYVIILVSLLLVLILSWWLANSITRPVHDLLELADNAADLSDAEIPFLAADDEFALLHNRLLEILYRQQMLENQIETTGLPDPEEMQGMNLRAERRMTSLLLVDVANIHTAVELLHPATLSTLLQEYQFYLRQAVRLYRGVIIRIDGNRVLATFDVRHCEDDHASNAICCGQLFLKLMQKVALQHKAASAQSLEFNLAVHSGDAFFSPYWKKKKSGKDTAREETVIGKPVDLAYQLIGSSPSGHVLASELSLDLAGGQKRFGNIESSEFNTGTDNLGLMIYILTIEHGDHGALLDKQCLHLLPDPNLDQSDGH